MSKRISLLRHAKSDWETGQEDFDRPLNKRGMKDAPQMGQHLRGLGISPQLMITSDAVRARTTAQLVGAELGLREASIVLAHGLYNAPAAKMLKVLCELGAASDDVVLVGHNPGITALANYLSDAAIDNMPPGSFFAVDADINDWTELQPGKGRFALFERPKAI